jgi:hypothetical protein
VENYRTAELIAATKCLFKNINMYKISVRKSSELTATNRGLREGCGLPPALFNL